MKTSIISNSEESKKLPQLIKNATTYKLIVPQNVEEKIRYLIRKYPSTEWSGVLFYSHQGTFEDNNLVITCQDIFPMDLGTSGWTEFKMSEDVAAYMAQNIELFDYDLGLVHSHHSMGAFFSGQDMKMLAQEGDDTNCFVSLVVDTRGSYVAAITRKIQTKSEVTIKNLGTSYEFFGEGAKELTSSNSQTIKVVDKEVIEYFDLEVERHTVPNSLEYLDQRFDEITKKKESAKKSILPWENYKSQLSTNKKKIVEATIDFEKEVPFTKDDAKKLDSVIVKNWTPNAKLIHEAVVHIITCSLLISSKNFALEEWIEKHLDKCYSRLFPENDPTAFDEWKDFIIQHTLDHFNDPDTPESAYSDIDYYLSTIATAISDELFPYANNLYISAYCDALSLYITE